jgi:hypothetical protein
VWHDCLPIRFSDNSMAGLRDTGVWISAGSIRRHRYEE